MSGEKSYVTTSELDAKIDKVRLELKVGLIAVFAGLQLDLPVEVAAPAVVAAAASIGWRFFKR